MKKVLYLSFAALLAIVGCSKENGGKETVATKTTTLELTLTSTKATINDSGSGAASFAWETGDEIGVAVDGELVKFTLEEFEGSKAKFKAELAEGKTLKEGAFVGYPYVPEDCVDGAFAVSFPKSYDVPKPDAFRLRWSGTLKKEDDGSFSTAMAHTGAILRVTYSALPLGAVAANMFIDADDTPVTVNFTEDLLESVATAKDFSVYFPVPEGDYDTIEFNLADSKGVIGGTATTLANKKGGKLSVEAGKIYRAPEVEFNMYDLVDNVDKVNDGTYIIVSKNKAGQTVAFSFSKTMENAKAAAESVKDVHGLSNLLAKGTEIYKTAIGGNYVELDAELGAESIIVPAEAEELAAFEATGNANAGKATLESELGNIKVDKIIVEFPNAPAATISAQFNAPDLVAALKDFRGTDIPVTFDYLIDFAVEQAAKEGVTFTDDQVDRLRSGFEHLCRTAKDVLASHNMGTLMDITLQTNVLDVFERYYDNVCDYSLQVSSEKKFGWATPIGFYTADDGFTTNVALPNYGWFTRLNDSLKGKTKDECVEYWAQFDTQYNIMGIENFFERASRRALGELADSTYDMLVDIADQDKFITIGNVYKRYAERINDTLDEVYIYKKYVAE